MPLEEREKKMLTQEYVGYAGMQVYRKPAGVNAGGRGEDRVKVSNRVESVLVLIPVPVELRRVMMKIE